MTSTSCLSIADSDPIHLSTQALRNLLPYRAINSKLLYLNDQSIGFGMHLFIQDTLSLQQLHDVLPALSLQHPNEVHCSLIQHGHHALSLHRYYLFVSTLIKPQQDKNLARFRCQLELSLDRHKIRYAHLKSPDFLLILRSLMSPNLNSTIWPGLINVADRPFNQIIPNPGTTCTLFPKHLDLRSPSVSGLVTQTRIIQSDIKPANEHCVLGSPAPMTFNWLQTITLKTVANQAAELVLAVLTLITPPEEALDHLSHTTKTYASSGLRLQTSTVQLNSFLSTLPFGYTEIR